MCTTYIFLPLLNSANYNHISVPHDTSLATPVLEVLQISGSPPASRKLITPVTEMPPKTPLLTKRIQKLETLARSQSDELQELRLFCLDLHPDYSKRVISTMLEIEQKVFTNVSNFEGRLAEINKTVKQLVSESANSCLEIVNSAMGSKMAGLDNRLIGLNKRQAKIDKELTDTLQRLNEFSDSVEKSLEEANDRAMNSLELKLSSRVAELVQQQLTCTLLFDHTLCKSLNLEPRPNPTSFTSTPCLERGRSRETFRSSQERLVLRARSVSSDAELREVIYDARTLAIDRVQI